MYEQNIFFYNNKKSNKMGDIYYTEKNNKELYEVNRLIDEMISVNYIDNNKKNKIYSRVKNIIDHDLWYSQKERENLYLKCQKVKFFTQKQKDSLKYSSIIERYHEEYEDGCPDGMNINDWEDYLDRQSY